MTQSLCRGMITKSELAESAEARLLLAKGFRLAATDFSEADQKRFWSYVQIRGPDDCWNWTGYKRRGYGQITILRGPPREVRAHATHRVSYAINYGEVPSGFLVCHRCDNPSCVNPNHLWLGTYADNNMDRVRKNRCNQPVGEHRGHSKLTGEKVISMKRERKKGMTQQALADKYGVARGTVARILARKTWRHIA